MKRITMIIIATFTLALLVYAQSRTPQVTSPASLTSTAAAFQKINFLRDIKSDHEERGRVYFPGVDFSRFSQEDKWRI